MVFPFGITSYKDLIDNSELGSSGYYPIGTGNIWHSGVHINYKSGERIINSIIPGGKVVAFRLNSEYKSCDLPQNLTEDAFLHEFSGYKDKYDEIMEDGFKYYSLKDNDDDKTYDVSDNFILLQHEIEDEHLSKKLVFYSLYMNLAPITKDSSKTTRTLHTKDNPFYPDCMIDSTTKEIKNGFNTIDFADSQAITKIGKPGFLKGEWYFDFCIFTEKSIFEIKEKISGNKKELFHHIKNSIPLYTKGGIKECEKRSFYWPTGTSAEKNSYTDNGRTVYKYEIIKIRPIIETGENGAIVDVDYKIEGENIKILKIDNLWLSGKKICETEFQLKNIVGKTFKKETVLGKPAFYIEKDNFESVLFWTFDGNLTSAKKCRSV